MAQDRGALGERLELQLVDGRTGEVKRHLVVVDGVCINLKSNWNLALEIQQTKELIKDILLRKIVGKPE